MNAMIFYPILVLLASSCWAFQPLINTRLSQNLDSAIWASFINFLVGTVFLLIVAIAINGKFMTLDTNGLRWWMFLGGVLGAIGVTVAIYSVPHLGIATFIALLIAGQLIFSGVLDHYGILVSQPNPMTWMKFFGMVLLAIGALMTLKG